jgi:hypothetical protein
MGTNGPPSDATVTPATTAGLLLTLRGPTLALARALIGRGELRGMDLILRARVDRDGSVALVYDVQRSPGHPLGQLL